MRISDWSSDVCSSDLLTYEEVEAKYGWSRGRIYNLAKRTNARKTEARIAERRSEREQRQREALEALIEKTTTMDVFDYLDDLPNGFAQLVCTSVPYNIGKPYQDGASADSMRQDRKSTRLNASH